MRSTMTVFVKLPEGANLSHQYDMSDQSHLNLSNQSEAKDQTGGSEQSEAKIWWIKGQTGSCHSCPYILILILSS